MSGHEPQVASFPFHLETTDLRPMLGSDEGGNLVVTSYCSDGAASNQKGLTILTIHMDVVEDSSLAIMFPGYPYYSLMCLKVGLWLPCG